jgi:protein SDA1
MSSSSTVISDEKSKIADMMMFRRDGCSSSPPQVATLCDHDGNCELLLLPQTDVSVRRTIAVTSSLHQQFVWRRKHFTVTNIIIIIMISSPTVITNGHDHDHLMMAPPSSSLRAGGGSSSAAAVAAVAAAAATAGIALVGGSVGGSIGAPHQHRRPDVTLKLSQLQNFCKRDPDGYRAEYDAQARRLESELEILALQGGKANGGGSSGALLLSGGGPIDESGGHGAAATRGSSASVSSSPGGTPLQELMQFVAAVSSSSYKGEESDRIAGRFIRLLVGPDGDAGSNGSGGHAESGRVLGSGCDDRNASGPLAEPGEEPQSGALRERSSFTRKKRQDKVLDVSSVTFLASSALQLDRPVRHTAVSCLILMRNKGAVDPLRLLPIFFRLLAVVPDKALRELLYRHMVQDVTNLNKRTGNAADSVNRSLQSFLHRIVETHGQEASGNAGVSSTATAGRGGGGGGGLDPECATSVAARRATDMVADLYRRRVWTGAREVAILASAAVSANPGVAARAIRFFLNIEEKMAEDQHRDRERKAETKMKIDYHAHSKKTAARQRHVERQKKSRAKMLKKREEEENGSGGDTYLDLAHDKGVEASKKLYPAIELLRDPQGLAEGELFLSCLLRDDGNRHCIRKQSSEVSFF